MQPTLALPLFSLALASLARSHADIQVPLQVAAREDDLAFSPPHYPSPWMNPEAPGWEDAYVRAKEFVSQLTLPEKVNLTTGVG